jgi:hypothetical protein
LALLGPAGAMPPGYDGLDHSTLDNEGPLLGELCTERRDGTVKVAGGSWPSRSRHGLSYSSACSLQSGGRRWVPAGIAHIDVAASTSCASSLKT